MEKQLEILFSEVRMNVYTENEYINNIKYSMELYPKFHIFEIALRNKIDNYIKNHLLKDILYITEFITNVENNEKISIIDLGKFKKIINSHPSLSQYTNKFNSVDNQTINTCNTALNQLKKEPMIQKSECNWLLDVFNENSSLIFDKLKTEQIKESYKRIAKKTAITHDDLLSNLNLGFWISMFEEKFLATNNIKPSGYFSQIFKRKNPSLEDIRKIKKELYLIKDYRNRISHFEKITYKGNKNQNLENHLTSYINSFDQNSILTNLLTQIYSNQSKQP